MHAEISAAAAETRIREAVSAKVVQLSDKRFEELVQTYGRDVLNVAFRVTGDSHLAQDVYQEVFLAIWQHWGSYSEDPDWGAYLYRVAVRKALELIRRQRSATVSLDDGGEAGAVSDPGQALMFDELQQRLNATLAELPKRQADVFVLSRIEGLDHMRIAEILGCSRNTVRVSLCRAAKRLARALKAYGS
jgi:RNA polymerase sigma-70 factor (ECF subfamily)